MRFQIFSSYSNWPSDSASLQQLVCCHYRHLTELSCCARETCSLQKQGRFEIPRKFEDNRGLRWQVNTDLNKIKGPSHVRREPITLFAIGTAVLNGAFSSAVGNKITSFALFGAQQSKIKEKVAKLSTLVGKLSKTNQNQWNN